MTRLPRFTGNKVIATLAKAGFESSRVKGSHHFLQHPDGRATVVPVHSGETIGLVSWQRFYADCELTPGEFQAFL